MPGGAVNEGRDARKRVDEALRKAEQRNQEIETLLRSGNAPAAGSAARGRLVREYLLNKGILAHAKAAHESREKTAEREFRSIVGTYAAYDKDADGKTDKLLETLRTNAAGENATEMDKGLDPDGVLGTMKQHVHTSQFTPLEAALSEEKGLDEISDAYGRSVERSKAYQALMDAGSSDLLDKAIKGALGFAFGRKPDKQLPADRAAELSSKDTSYAYTKALLNQTFTDKYDESRKLQDYMDGLNTRHRAWFPQNWADSNEMTDLKHKTRALFNKTQETSAPREDDPDYAARVWDVLMSSRTYSNRKELDNRHSREDGPSRRMGRERLRAAKGLNDHATSLVVEACLKNRSRKLSPEEREMDEQQRVLALDKCTKALEKLQRGSIGGFRHQDSEEAAALREKTEKLRDALKNARPPFMGDPYVIEAMVDANEASAYYRQKKDYDNTFRMSSMARNRYEGAEAVGDLTRDMLMSGMMTEKARERERQSTRTAPESLPGWESPKAERRENEAEHEFAARRQAYEAMGKSLRELTGWAEPTRDRRRGGPETTKAFMKHSAARVIAVHNCLDETAGDPESWKQDLARYGEDAFEQRVEAEAQRLERTDPASSSRGSSGRICWQRRWPPTAWLSAAVRMRRWIRRHGSVSTGASRRARPSGMPPRADRTRRSGRSRSGLPSSAETTGRRRIYSRSSPRSMSRYSRRRSMTR